MPCPFILFFTSQDRLNKAAGWERARARTRAFLSVQAIVMTDHHLLPGGSRWGDNRWRTNLFPEAGQSNSFDQPLNDGFSCESPRWKLKVISEIIRMDVRDYVGRLDTDQYLPLFNRLFPAAVSDTLAA